MTEPSTNTAVATTRYQAHSRSSNHDTTGTDTITPTSNSRMVLPSVSPHAAGHQTIGIPQPPIPSPIHHEKSQMDQILKSRRSRDSTETEATGRTAGSGMTPISGISTMGTMLTANSPTNITTDDSHGTLPSDSTNSRRTKASKSTKKSKSKHSTKSKQSKLSQTTTHGSNHTKSTKSRLSRRGKHRSTKTESAALDTTALMNTSRSFIFRRDSRCNNTTVELQRGRTRLSLRPQNEVNGLHGVTHGVEIEDLNGVNIQNMNGIPNGITVNRVNGTNSGNCSLRKRSKSPFKSRIPTITGTLNAREEIAHLASQRKLVQIERQQLDREKQSFLFQRKKHDTEIWAIKHDYNEQTKVLKKHHAIYKQRIADLQDIEEQMGSAAVSTTQSHVQCCKLETKEKLVRSEQKSVHKMKANSQALYQRCTRLLEEVSAETKQMEIWSRVCEQKWNEERVLVEQQEEDRKHHLEMMSRLREEMVHAPWLMLSGKEREHGDPDLNALHQRLLVMYEALREEKRQFKPEQREWMRAGMRRQGMKEDEKAVLQIRQKLQRMRDMEKQCQMEMLEEVKVMLEGGQSEFDEQRMRFKVEFGVVHCRL